MRHTAQDKKVRRAKFERFLTTHPPIGAGLDESHMDYVRLVWWRAWNAAMNEYLRPSREQ